jgi:hypothetical protein
MITVNSWSSKLELASGLMIEIDSWCSKLELKLADD